MDKLTIACVLKSGGDYLPEHVQQLAAGIRKHVKKPYRLVCLSDVHVKECERIPLAHGWPGWWSKIELFKPGNFDSGRVIYLDLDSVVCDDFSMIASDHFCMLHSFSKPENPGSGVMAWSGDFSPIYDAFKANAKKAMEECTTSECWGDQGFIFKNGPGRFEYFQDKFPGKIVSYKKDCAGGRAPQGAAIVCYHGKPRPWEAPLKQLPLVPRAKR